MGLATMADTVYRLAILTISDAGAKGERADTSGDAIAEIMDVEGYRQVDRAILPDEREQVSEQLASWCDGGEVDIVLTTGGTGLGPRDVTPEATKDVIDVEVPGIPEAIRLETRKSTAMAVLSRGVAGLRNGCLIINLPGSPNGVRQCLNVAIPVIPHALQMAGDGRDHPDS